MTNPAPQSRHEHPNESHLKQKGPMNLADATAAHRRRMPHVRALQPFIQCELRFLSLGRMGSAHPHFFGCQSARTLFRSKLILIPGFGLRLWLVLRLVFRWGGPGARTGTSV